MTKQEYEDRLFEIKTNCARIEGLDADIRASIGSNEPLATFRVLKALEDGPKTAAEIRAHVLANGYTGPLGRLQEAIGKLANDFRKIQKKDGRYFIVSSSQSV